MLCPNCKIDLGDGEERKICGCGFVRVKNSKVITEVFAWLSVDAKGNEGIMTVLLYGEITPCVFSKIENAEMVKRIFFKESPGVKVRLAKFTSKEILEELF